MYLANNRIPTSREVLNIKHLNKLIILDMCGNPLTKDPNYRIYSLYHLKKLKVSITNHFHYKYIHYN